MTLPSRPPAAQPVPEGVQTYAQHLIDVIFRRGLGLDARKQHARVLRPCHPDHSPRGTLYRQMDEAGRHFMILTDDPDYNVAAWGNDVQRVSIQPYQPRFQTGNRHPFVVRLARIRRVNTPQARNVELPLEGDEQIDAMITRLSGAAGFDALHYEVEIEPSMTLTPRAGSNDTRGHIHTMTVRGQLRVREPQLLVAAHLTGMGRKKRYGCGLLLTEAPAP